MLRRVREGLHRWPAVARLVAIAALLLVAAAAHLAAQPGPVGRWLPLLVVAVVGALVTGAPRHRWPLPAIWLVATVLAVTRGSAVDPGTTATALAVGAVTLVAALAADVVPVLRSRHRRVER